MKILVVDDDEITRELLDNALSISGYEVITACDGREALDILQQGRCRFVISDWEMPNLNGVQLCQAIRGGDYNGYVYVILLTSRNRKEDTVEGMNAGADDFISKPFEPNELMVRVRAGERILSLETRDLTIFAMAKLAESRDPETGAHLERVRNYSKVLAKQLHRQNTYSDQVDLQYCRLIYLTSPLHDIGKVAIPDSVLLKPGRLSDQEFQIMKTHTTAGAETLDAALKQHPGVPFLQMARDIAAYHHERCDGKGYPNGLAGENIPLCARLVAVADVYDALTSKRVYKNAMPHDVARGILLQDSGTHFDAQIIEAFTQVEDRFIAIRDQYADDHAIAA